MQPLEGLDAAFLSLETPTTPLHVGAVLVLDPPEGARSLFSPSTRYAQIRRVIAQRLHLVGPLRQRALRAGQAEHGIETVDPFRHRLARGNETCDRSRQLGWANRVDELVGMTPGGEDPAQDLAQGRSVRQLGIWRQELSQSGGLAAQIRNDRPQLGFAHPLSDLAPELEGARRVDYRTGDHCPIASVGRHEGERPQVGDRLHGRSGS